MKKFLVSLLLLIIGGFPLLVTAEEKEESKDFEITDDGIIIYGEDISELSEEELQYIPKDWREGNFNPEHDHEGEEEELITPFSNYPDVNSYIENISPVETSYQHKDMFTKFPYRNGVGEVEGVVAHETANDNSTIWGEISYMEQNHTSAFVHAFVDHNNVVEIHSPDYGAWGAGRFANERFVHVELVRVNNFDQFANSINNYAEYIANILYDYNLGVSSAESSGKGTLWSHKAVTNHLGGTNHVDPHGYFARYGYNWNEFTSLVTDKYNSIAVSKKANTSKLGQLNSNNVTKYDNPVSQSGASSISGEDANKVFYIKAEAVIDNKQYYLISNQASSSNGVVGWIEAKDIKVHNHNGIDNESKTLVVNGKGNAYSKAWGGSTDLVYNLSSYAGEEFKVNKTEKVGSNIWYRGILDGKQVFIHEAYVDEITE
ncbi:peptidoglycan recognition protein family protein, partial [Oceanobacillus neutriphilus]|uniref:peptidoglycan recognition protein family protein n=1 Tax=Oceanobacillus neutriphilus TaxID=531815 RepID=UPI001E5441AF